MRFCNFTVRPGDHAPFLETHGNSVRLGRSVVLEQIMNMMDTLECSIFPWHYRSWRVANNKSKIRWWHRSHWTTQRWTAYRKSHLELKLKARWYGMEINTNKLVKRTKLWTPPINEKLDTRVHRGMETQWTRALEALITLSHHIVTVCKGFLWTVSVNAKKIGVNHLKPVNRNPFSSGG